MAWPGTDILRALIDDYEGRGEQLLVCWNAGGDNTLIWCSRRLPGGELVRVEEVHLKVLEQLCDDVIETLDLPNAGDFYHVGRGRVSVDELGAVKLEVNSREYRMAENYDWLEGSDSMSAHRLCRWTDSGLSDAVSGSGWIELPVEHHHSVESVFHRAEMRLIGELDASYRYATHIDIAIINGDEVSLSAEAHDHYELLILEALDACKPYLEQTPEPCGLHLEALLEPGSVVRFRVVDEAFATFRVYNHETVVLSTQATSA